MWSAPHSTFCSMQIFLLAGPSILGGNNVFRLAPRACPPAGFERHLHRHSRDVSQGPCVRRCGQINIARTAITLACETVSVAGRGLGGLYESLSLRRST